MPTGDISQNYILLAMWLIPRSIMTLATYLVVTFGPRWKQILPAADFGISIVCHLHSDCSVYQHPDSCASLHFLRTTLTSSTYSARKHEGCKPFRNVGTFQPRHYSDPGLSFTGALYLTTRYTTCPGQKSFRGIRHDIFLKSNFERPGGIY